MIGLNSTSFGPMKTVISSTPKYDNNLEEVKKNLDENEVVVITKLYGLKNVLSSDQLNMSAIKRQIDELSSFQNSQNFAYLNDLIHPEKARGCKIPSQIPIPSCSFQMKNSITLSTNASGCVALFMNPCFLANETVIGTKDMIPGVQGGDRWLSEYASSVWVNNDPSLNGNSSNTMWDAVNLGQTLPPVYDQYRVVSGSLNIKYIGRLDAVQGEIGGAILCESVNTFGGKNSNIAPPVPQPGPSNTSQTRARGLIKYGNFDYAEDAVYSNRNMTLEGMRLLYFPLDNSYEEFAKVASNQDVELDKNSTEGWQEWIQVGKKQNGFNWFFWCRGGPASSPCFRVDICLNFECMPSASFLNYMPVSLSPCFLSLEEKRKAIILIQSRPIMKANEENVLDVAIPDIFMRMIRKFKNGIPGFDKLRACGLIGAVPSLKPGLALAGNMIASNMAIDNYY